ncbi:MAG: hypothetical protein QF541_04180 [Lentisphaeria bacterium]|jgi:hypothetical protein|nr:hypothetical protein [Lentisphaeria bacterium]
MSGTPKSLREAGAAGIAFSPGLAAGRAALCALAKTLITAGESAAF